MAPCRGCERTSDPVQQRGVLHLRGQRGNALAECGVPRCCILQLLKGSDQLRRLGGETSSKGFKKGKGPTTLPA